MKKVLVSLLIGVSLLSVGCGGTNQPKELTAYEINSITSLRETITDVDTWYLYYNENDLAIGHFAKDKGLLKKGTVFSWGYSFDDIIKNDEGLFEKDGEKLSEFDYRNVVFNDLDQVISNEFIINEDVNDDDLFLGVFEIEKVTKDKVYLNVKKTVLCKNFMDLNNNVTLVEIY